MTLTIAVLFLCLGACNSDDKHEHPVEHSAAHDSQAADMSITDIPLNNGMRWKADSATHRNVRYLVNVVKQDVPGDIPAYHQKAQQLNEGISRMVSECRMKGPEHEALHHWLEPLMADVKQLAHATREEDARATYSRIQDRLDAYSKLFE